MKLSDKIIQYVNENPDIMNCHSAFDTLEKYKESLRSTFGNDSEYAFSVIDTVRSQNQSPESYKKQLLTQAELLLSLNITLVSWVIDSKEILADEYILIWWLKFPKNPWEKIRNNESLKIRELQGWKKLCLYNRDSANTLAHNGNYNIFTLQDLQKILPELQGNTEEEKIKHLYTMLWYPVFNAFDPKNDDINSPSCDIWLPDISKPDDVVMLCMNFDGWKFAIERNDHISNSDDWNHPSYGVLVIELWK